MLFVLDQVMNRLFHFSAALFQISWCSGLKPAGSSYRDDQRGDAAGHAGQHPAHVQHPHVLSGDDDGEAEDEGQRAGHQGQLPADPLHHPAAQQAAHRRSHRHDGL